LKITAFNGSPRAEMGNTHVMVEEFLRGAKEAGAEVENIFLARKDIKHCIGCFSCWAHGGECVIKDDMKELLPKYLGSDMVVFATPLYTDNVTGIMKGFMDRLIPLGDPHLERDESGETRHRGGSEGSPEIIVISNCAFPEQSQFQVLHHIFQRVTRSFHSNIVAEIYRGEGSILSDPPAAYKPLIWKYRKLVKRAGREVVENGSISDDTISQLERPLLPFDEYLRGANERWDRILAEGLGKESARRGGEGERPQAQAGSGRI